MPQRASANECFEPLLKRELSRLTYDVRVKADSVNLHAWAHLEDDGTLILDLKTKSRGGERIDEFRGADEFAKIMRHFDGRVKRVQGLWVIGSDNLGALNAGLDRGLSLEDAARETWTGKQAAKFGYTEVSILETEGAPGQLKSVRVWFVRPRSRAQTQTIDE